MPVLPIVRVADFDSARRWPCALRRVCTTPPLCTRRMSRGSIWRHARCRPPFCQNGPSYAGIGVGGEGFTTFTIATPTGEGTTSARTFARLRRCVLTNGFPFANRGAMHTFSLQTRLYSGPGSPPRCSALAISTSGSSATASRRARRCLTDCAPRCPPATASACSAILHRIRPFTPWRKG